MDSKDQEDIAQRRREIARQWNEWEARRVARDKRWRLLFTLAFFAGGLLLTRTTWYFLYAVPCFGIAFVFFLLYLDAHMSLKEIKARNWASITPRFGKPKKADDAGTAKDPSGKPP